MATKAENIPTTTSRTCVALLMFLQRKSPYGSAERLTSTDILFRAEAFLTMRYPPYTVGLVVITYMPYILTLWDTGASLEHLRGLYPPAQPI